MEILRGAKPAPSLSIRHPEGERLPSSSIDPELVRAPNLTGLGLPGCPRAVRGGTDRVAVPLPTFRQAYLVTPGRQILCDRRSGDLLVMNWKNNDVV